MKTYTHTHTQPVKPKTVLFVVANCIDMCGCVCVCEWNEGNTHMDRSIIHDLMVAIFFVNRTVIDDWRRWPLVMLMMKR